MNRVFNGAFACVGRASCTRYLFVAPGILFLFFFLVSTFAPSYRQAFALQQAVDRESFHQAAELCRGDVPRPMALIADKWILCFDGWIDEKMNSSMVTELREGGLFVVRSFGGDVQTAITLSNLLHDRHATVVIYDYCLSACASYFFIASDQTYVLRGALVAWRNSASSLPDCPSFGTPRDMGPKKMRRLPCPEIPLEMRSVYSATMHAADRFYAARTIDRSFERPPDSSYIRRTLKNLYDETGVYPNVGWTWNPRYLQSTFKTKVYYEAYPGSQEEVDAMVARLHLGRVIYDP